jgi:hypothetical protein
MDDKRRHKRLKLDLVEMRGEMSLAHHVDIIDISLGGASLKADRRLNIGKEIALKLSDKECSVEIKGIVVRSELSGIEEAAAGERVSLYTAGVMFKDGQSETIISFFNLFVQHIKDEEPVEIDRRLNVRFRITPPELNIMSFPAQFLVKEISMVGMRIRTDQALRMQSMIPMELSLNTHSPVSFIGRVASCRMLIDQGHAHFEIGVEFSFLAEKAKTLLRGFIDYLAVMETNADEEQPDA